MRHDSAKTEEKEIAYAQIQAVKEKINGLPNRIHTIQALGYISKGFANLKVRVFFLFLWKINTLKSTL